MEESATSQNYEEIDIADIVSQLVRRWKFILIMTVLGALAAFIISTLWLPRVYESKATIFVQQSSLSSSLLRDLPISLGAGSSGSSGYLITLMKSDSMMRTLIHQLNLSHKLFPHDKNVDTEKVLKKLNDSISVQDDKSGSIKVIVHANNSQLAADIANSMLNNLGGFVSTSSQRKTDYISTKLSDTEKKMNIAENEMARFQERNNIAAIDEETKALIEKLSELDARSLALNVEYQQVDSQLKNSGDLNSLVDLEVKKKSIESSKTYVAKNMADLQKRINNLPGVALQYARLKRKVEILSKTYELLIEQYQLANISQHGENGDYQIIDRAQPVKKPIAPRKVFNAGLGGMLFFFVAAFTVIKSSRATYRKRHYVQ